MVWVKIWGKKRACALTTSESVVWNILYRVSEKSGDGSGDQSCPGNGMRSKMGWRWFDAWQMPHPTNLEWKSVPRTGGTAYGFTARARLGRLSKPSASGHALLEGSRFQKSEDTCHWHPARPGKCLHGSRGQIAHAFPLWAGPVHRGAFGRHVELKGGHM